MAAVAAGMALKYLCRRRVTEVLEDELVYRIAEKASYMTLRVSALTFAVLAAVLIALSKTGDYAAVEPIGLTLAFSVGTLLKLHLFFYGYYSRKGLEG